jgi:hypothetical protein
VQHIQRGFKGLNNQINLKANKSNTSNSKTTTALIAYQVHQLKEGLKGFYLHLKRLKSYLKHQHNHRFNELLTLTPQGVFKNVGATPIQHRKVFKEPFVFILRGLNRI